MAHKHFYRRKAKPRFHRRTQPGATPGSLIADPNAPPPAIHVIAYGPDKCVEEDLVDAEQVRPLLGKYPVVWIHVAGLGDAELVARFGRLFGLHPLALEDVLNVHQRAKVEQYDNHLFITARVARLDEHLYTQQLSLFLGRNYVLTFGEAADGCTTPVAQRLRNHAGRLREAGPDGLAYALIDAAIDSYFPVLEEFGERLDVLDDVVAASRPQRAIDRIHDLRSDLLVLRRAIWPHREALNVLARDPNPLVGSETRVFLRDCYDHTVQIIDLLETYRDMCSDLRDFCLSAISNRLNEIMKVLTIMSTIFIPLSFVAGLYGMNFDAKASPWNMPELGWRFGYFFAIGIMAAVAGSMLFFFWRRGWLGDNHEKS